MVGSAFMLTHTSQVPLVISTTPLVTRVQAHLMLVSSTAHMFHYRWFVQLARIPSSQKLDLRLATASSLILLQQPLPMVLSLFRKRISTIVVQSFQILCNNKIGFNPTRTRGGLRLPSFFINK